MEFSQERNFPNLTYFLIDGLDRKIFNSLLSQSKIPNIQSLIENGSWVPFGITSFPSMTGYAFYPFLTGQDASMSGIMGLRDVTQGKAGIRNYVGKSNKHLNDDLHMEFPTLFEKFPQNYSFSIQSYMNRGVKKQEKIKWPLISAKFGDVRFFKFLKRIPLINKSLYDFFSYENLIIEKAIADLKNNPKIQWITLSATDTCCHLEGSSELYEKLVIHVDNLIGKYINASKTLEKEGRIFCVISDHGTSNVHTNLDLGKIISEKFGVNVKTSFESSVISDSLENSLRHYSNIDIVACLNGNAGLYMYFRNQKKLGEGAWKEPIPIEMLRMYNTKLGPIDFIHEVAKIEGVDLIFTRSSRENSSEIHNLNGSSRISYDPKSLLFKYEILSGDDPLHLDSTLIGISLTAEEWLQRTFDSDYPYGVIRSWRAMQASTSGDMMVTAKIGFDFGKDMEPIVKSYRGAHGSLCKEHMIVPFIIQGPGVKKGGQIQTATSEDLGATLFALLGEVSNGIGVPITEFISK